MELKELMTIREVATYLKINPRTVRRWIAKGKLSRIDLTEQTIRIPKEDVIRLTQEDAHCESWQKIFDKYENEICGNPVNKGG